MAGYDAAALTQTLVVLDPAFEAVVSSSEPCTLGRPNRRESHFASLARAICHQQLAGAAARAIHGRLQDLYDCRPTADAVLATDFDVLRRVGLSRSKVAALTDLAEHVLDGRVDLASIGRRSDEEVIETLTTVRGIGRWTAEMFLMFQLARPDVWPVDDLGVRYGWGHIHKADAPSPKELRAAGEPLSGVRSVAAWYCWQAVGQAPSG